MSLADIIAALFASVAPSVPPGSQAAPPPPAAAPAGVAGAVAGMFDDTRRQPGYFSRENVDQRFANSEARRQELLAGYTPQPGWDGIRSISPFLTDPNDPTGETQYWSGLISTGLRGAGDNAYGVELGGENTNWATNPDIGQQELAYAGGDGAYYLLSDLIRHYGSLDNAQRNAPDWGGDDTRSGFQNSFARGSNDFMSGEDFLPDLMSWLPLALPVIAPALGIGAAAGAGGAAAAPVGAEAAAAAGEAITGGSGAAAAEAAGLAAPTGLAAVGAAIPSWLQQPALNFGVNLLGSGGDPIAAARNTALSSGIGYGADFAAPYVSEGVDAAGGMFGDLSRGSPSMASLEMPADAGAAYSGGMPAASLPFDPTFGGTLDTVTPGVYQDFNAPAAAPTGAMPAAVAEADPTLGGALRQVAPGEFAAPQTTAAAAPPTVTSQDLQKYVKLGKQLSDILGADESAPQRPAEGEDQTAYSEELVKYLNLDAQAMADAGLQPGSPEYLDYILQQADSIITQIFGDNFEMSDEELSAALRSKTQEELVALQRALYVRGQLGQQMGTGTYTDPTSGGAEEVIGNGMFNPGVGAYQRGLARNVDTLGSMGGEDAYAYLQQILGRNADFFGMQDKADKSFEQAKLQDDERRRRGMFG